MFVPFHKVNNWGLFNQYKGKDFESLIAQSQSLNLPYTFAFNHYYFHRSIHEN
jgi:hypothetical protein